MKLITCTLVNLLLVHILNGNSPSDISDTYSLRGYDSSHNTRGKTLGLLAKPHCRNTKFGLNSVVYQSILNWNELQRHFQDTNLSVISRTKLQKLAFSFFIQQYLSWLSHINALNCFVDLKLIFFTKMNLIVLLI